MDVISSIVRIHLCNPKPDCEMTKLFNHKSFNTVLFIVTGRRPEQVAAGVNLREVNIDVWDNNIFL